jgi:hypothetical protein
MQPIHEKIHPQGEDQSFDENLITLRLEIGNLTAEICKSIDKKLEPVQTLQRLNFLLDANFEDVWKMINTPANFLQEPKKQSEASKDESLSAAAQIDSKPKGDE